MSTPTEPSSSPRRSKRRKIPSTPPENPTPASPKSQARRVFTDDDEIRLLKAFYKLTKNSPSLVGLGSPAPGLVAKFISDSGYGDFSHAQVTQKLRNLRAKYHRLARTKSLIKTPHQRQIYETARKIWGKDQVPKHQSNTEQAEPAGINNVCRARKDEAELENFPVLMTQFSRYFPGDGMWREGLKRLEASQLRALNNKWILLEVEEAGVSAKKAELSHKLIKLIMEAYISSSSN